MPNQPHPTVTAADVNRIVRRDFPAEQVTEVLAMLEEYGPARSDPEPYRVRLAALKIAAGDLKLLREEIDIAKIDFRDILAWAEYPEYSKRMSHIRKLPPEEVQQIIDADWAQYQVWLK